MFRLATLISLVAASAQAATYDRYAGYSPATSITDNAAMDLDQLKFNEQLYARKNNNAKQVYIQGGHSGSYAMMKLVGLDGGGAKSYPAGTRVLGTNEAGGIVEGTLQNDVAWTADDSVAIVNVTYNVGDRQATYLTCQVGGLYVFGEANRAGCKSFRRGNQKPLGLVDACPHSRSISNIFLVLYHLNIFTGRLY